MRTGILGGTFDPIHIAHLHAGEVALDQAGLDRVLFVPAGDPWQKDGSTISPGHHRLEMVRAAIQGVAGLEADSREVDREGPTYTVDTLATFSDDEDLFLILGADAAISLPTWHRFEEVLDRVTILVVPRPGTSVFAVEAVLPQARFLDMALLDVSATGIRGLASQGRPFRYLVTEGVHRYILGNGLYANGSKSDILETQSEMEESS